MKNILEVGFKSVFHSCSTHSDICASSRTETIRQRLLPAEALMLCVAVLIISFIYKRKQPFFQMRPKILKWALGGMTGLAVVGVMMVYARLLIARSEVPTILEAYEFYRINPSCVSLFGSGLRSSTKHPCWIQMDSSPSLTREDTFAMLKRSLLRTFFDKRKFTTLYDNLSAHLGPLHVFRFPNYVQIRTDILVDRAYTIPCYPRAGALYPVQAYLPESPAYFGTRLVPTPEPRFNNAKDLYIEIENQFGCQAAIFETGTSKYLLEVYSAPLILKKLTTHSENRKYSEHH